MTLTKRLREAKVFPADIKRIKEMQGRGMTAEAAINSLYEEARKDLEEVRDELRGRGYQVDIRRIDKKEG